MGPAVVSLLAVSFVAWIIIRAGAKALEMTGLSREASHFQSVSAFFGTGFTTGESEMVVNHPVRRRVIRDLIVVGNIGLTTVVATVVVGVVKAGGESRAQIAVFIGLAAAGFGSLWLLSRSGLFVRALDWLIAYTLERVGVERALDYERMLRVRKGHTVSEIGVDENDWIAGKTLADLRLREEGVNVLGVAKSDGDYVGSPRGVTPVEVGDTLIVYAHEHAIEALAGRKEGPAGEQARREAIREQAERAAADRLAGG
jgi:hypothetical protein